MPPTFSRGVFFRSPNSEPHQVLAVAHYRATSRIDFICSLRPICETFFYFLLLAYDTGIHAHTSRSLPHGRHERRPPRESTSTPGWKEAQEHARQALALAVDAAGKASARDPSADDIADHAVEQLEQRLRLKYSWAFFSSQAHFFLLVRHSVAALPAVYKRDVDLMRFWDDNAVKFC